MFGVPCADASLMAPLVETRWTRFGHDRVYLKTANGEQIGHVDLKSGSFTVEIEEFADALVQCRDRWLSPPPATAKLAGPQPTRYDTVRTADDHRSDLHPHGISRRTRPAPQRGQSEMRSTRKRQS